MSRRVDFYGLDALTHFVREMFERGYEVSSMKNWGGVDVIEYKGLDVSDAAEVAYQGLNFEETWVRFTHEEADDQSVKFMLTGDRSVDIVPVADWTMKRNGVDVVREVYDRLREEYSED